MRDIYRNAYRVRVWFGTLPSATTYAAQRLLKQATSPDHYRPPLLSLPEEEAKRQIRSELESMLEADETPEQFMEHLRPFHLAAYWERKWIVQELVFAKSLRFYLGAGYFDFREDIHRYILWHNLHNFLANATEWYWSDADRSNEHVFGNLGMYVQGFLLAGMCTGWIPVEDNRQLLNYNVDCILNTRRSKATEPLDSIFTILGLLHDDLRIGPDYNIPMTDLFVQFTMHIARTTRSLRILDQAMLSRPDLPSWVPDFNRAHPPILTPGHDQNPSTFSVIHTLKVDSRTMTVPGLAIDEVLCAPRLQDVEHLTGRQVVKYAYTTWNSAYRELRSTTGDLADSNAFWLALDYIQPELEFLHGDFRAMTHLLRLMNSDIDTPEDKRGVEGLIGIFTRFVDQRILVFTSTARVVCAAKGLAEPQAGDKLMIIASARSVFCARPVRGETRNTFRLVNQCGVNGES